MASRTLWSYFPVLSTTPATLSSPRNPAAIQPGPQKAPSDPKNDTDQRSFRSQVRTQLLTANHPSNTDAVGTRVGAAAPGAPRASLAGGANDGEFLIPAQDYRGVRKRAPVPSGEHSAPALPCTEVKLCMQTYRSLYLRRLLLLLPLVLVSRCFHGTATGFQPRFTLRFFVG